MKLNKTGLYVIVGIVIVVILFVVLYMLWSGSIAGDSVIIEASNGYLVPGESLLGHEVKDFELPSLDGELIQLSQLRGKPVILNFGATWCQPCRDEAPVMQKLHQEYPGLVVLMVDIDEEPDVVGDFAESLGLTYPIVVDKGAEVAKDFGFVVIPTIYFIDADGIVQGILNSGSPENEIRSYLPAIGVEQKGLRD